MQLTLDQIREKAPSAFATTHAMSERYAQIQTTELLDRLSSSGFVPVAATQDNPTKRDPNLVAHAITLRHESFLNRKKVGDQVPQIVVVNSHNGRTKLRLYAGFYRFVCANGMVVGEDKWTGALRHSGDALVEAAVLAEDMGEEMERISHRIEDWNSLELSNHKANEFANEAAILRFGDTAKSYDSAALLEARRVEDEGRSLWKVFNVIQENTTKGGIVGESASGRKITSRGLTAIQPNIAFNRELWKLAENFAVAA